MHAKELTVNMRIMGQRDGLEVTNAVKPVLTIELHDVRVHVIRIYNIVLKATTTPASRKYWPTGKT